MLYRLSAETVAANALGTNGEGRRFVLHRHRDEGGAHLDLRLEQEGYLMGFRVDGPALGIEAWATMKAPHPLHWLDQDGDAVREDGGTYFWASGDASGGVLVLCGARETVRVRVDPVGGVTAGDWAGLRAAAERLRVPFQALAALAEDGAVARERAIARFVGLGRELDGEAFDDGLWRKTLTGERLGVVQQYLHALEVRFDRKYPPLPVSVPVALEEDDGIDPATGRARAMEILRQAH